jgi:anhydro-N-acetylmuramic acid kinase
MNTKRNQIIAGIMSGTSLDGVDIIFCSFTETNNVFVHTIHHAETVFYDNVWRTKLNNAHKLSAFEFQCLHVEYGKYLGQLVKQKHKSCCQKMNLQAVGSHGHTIFHQPEMQLTVQIGSGAHIASQTKVPVVCDFRTLDIALGGQGAPLVPLGDKLLFPEYDACINLGGFSNISYDNSYNKRLAFDICPVNIVINHFTRLIGYEYDNNGEIAAKGSINNDLLKQLNKLEYYQQPIPKSLGREWVEASIIPLINSYKLNTEDALRTMYEHIAIQIANNVINHSKVLVTGGGAYNSFLLELIKNRTRSEIIIPNSQLIDFKEALIFAFLAYLRLQNKVNILSSATGAKFDHMGGVVFNPKAFTNIKS